MGSPSKSPRSIALVQSPDTNSHSTLRLIGELDASTRPSIESRMFELAESEDTTIDLAPTTFIDLGSVRMLVACRERARLAGHSLEIVNAPQYVARMLEMLERGHYWRPQQAPAHGEGQTYEVPPSTTTDAERSRPDSEQIVRLQCAACGTQTFRPERSTQRTCEKCGGTLEVVAVFRDRRRLPR